MTAAEPVAVREVLLSGRAIGYRVYGDPDGTITVLSAHGGLVSGRDAAVLHEAAVAAGVRVLSPDRPGVGRSDRMSGRSLVDWGREDAAAVLADAGAEQAVALGWSAGGAYALSAGAHLPDRIRGVVVVAGALPLDDPATRAELNRMDRRLIVLAGRLPATAAGYFRVMRRLVRRDPALVERLSARSLGAADAVILHQHADWYDACLAEALVDIGGAVEEYRVFGAPWGFAPADVHPPVAVLQGEEDRLIRPDWADRLAAAVPDGRATHVAATGHFLPATHPGLVVDTLVALAG